MLQQRKKGKHGGIRFIKESAVTPNHDKNLSIASFKRSVEERLFCQEFIKGLAGVGVEEKTKTTPGIGGVVFAVLLSFGEKPCGPVRKYKKLRL